ncbi:Dpy-30 motif [Pyrenophora seminiperda CCB06]|uniref:Dpy-30 motif n=1 Tax=Pyrenophora seminiperda CCB06 TaxID=1302712 RepID=A0A3M7LWU4_9PLEO|nr:Dpy-30 motif [Pyrenophora seminiperda CCB06]
MTLSSLQGARAEASLGVWVPGCSKLKLSTGVVIGMADPSPNPTQQDMDIDPALMNGLAQQPPAEQPSTDVEMADSSAPQPTTDSTPPSLQPTLQTQPQTPSQAPPPTAPSAPTLPTAPTPTPASSRNSPHPPAQAPTQPIPHGSPTRVYLNQHVTPHLLEAMKHLATTEPEKPLKWLSEFLANKSAEIEGP